MKNMPSTTTLNYLPPNCDLGKNSMCSAVLETLPTAHSEHKNISGCYGRGTRCWHRWDASSQHTCSSGVHIDVNLTIIWEGRSCRLREKKKKNAEREALQSHCYYWGKSAMVLHDRWKIEYGHPARVCHLLPLCSPGHDPSLLPSSGLPLPLSLSLYLAR